MNGRIQELKDKAWATCEEPEQYMDKFAELLVKQCMEQVWYTREDMINDNISEVIKLRIKEHFGVEE